MYGFISRTFKNTTSRCEIYLRLMKTKKHFVKSFNCPCCFLVISYIITNVPCLNWDSDIINSSMRLIPLFSDVACAG